MNTQTVPVYTLSEAGKLLTWAQWKQKGGCGLSNHEEPKVASLCGPVSAWGDRVSLGQIAGASAVAARELARFAVTHLRRPEWALYEYKDGVHQDDVVPAETGWEDDDLPGKVRRYASIARGQCTIFFKLDVERHAEMSAAAFGAAEATAERNGRYPVAYPAIYETTGCGYGALAEFVRTCCSRLAEDMGLDMEVCHQTDLIVILYCGTTTSYQEYLRRLAEAMRPVGLWCL